MDNYIGKVDAEWVDPVVELPEQGHGIIVRNSDGGVSLAEWHNSPWPMGRWVAWLRIGGPSDAIPREAVQAAVDRIRDCANGLRREGYEPLGHDNALMHIANHTGVTPTEVQS